MNGINVRHLTGIATACTLAVGAVSFVHAQTAQPAIAGINSHSAVTLDDGEGKDWKLLGEKLVNYKTDHDVIGVKKDEGRFRGMRVRVEDGALEIFQIKVTFGDGDTFEPKTRLQFKEGQRTSDIDFPGTVRVVTKIEFYYKSDGNNGKATVRVFGKRASATD
jgi:hypothetical protein